MKVSVVCLFALTCLFFSAKAQTLPGKAGVKVADTVEKKAVPVGSLMPSSKAAPKAYGDVITKKAITRRGMISIHKIEDRYFFEIADSTLGRDILVVSRISKAGAEISSGANYAGDKVGSCVIRFEKAPNDRVFLRKLSFRVHNSDTTAAMYTSVQNSNIQAIAAAFNIAAYTPDKKGSIIDVTDFLNSDNDILYFNGLSKQTLKISALLADRSYINSLRGFPKNVELLSTKTYALIPIPGSSPAIGNVGSLGTTTMELNTSLVILPKVPMKSRLADPRIGYFTEGYTDFATKPQAVTQLSFVKRWRLEPKPQDVAKYRRGELVEPAKPIVFYIDPATPKKWVPFLMAGINDWQKAFEKAGFKNAIMAKMAPNTEADSTWSLDDATHSALVYKPSEIENASGPNISDPRSGEIIESHINWYHNIMKLVHDWYMIQAGAIDPKARKMQFDDELMGQLVRFVSSHEVGHTLGLTHNFGSSSTVPVENLRNKAWVEANGHTPSIMDYARFNYVAQPEDHVSEKGIFPRIGDYDFWAIEWGYRILPDVKTAAAEVPILNKITVEKLKNKRLWYSSEYNFDDPRSQNEDLGDDAMLAGTYGIKNLKIILPRLVEWSKTPNEDYSDLANMYNQLIIQFSLYMGHVTKNIGGIYYSPKTVEQPGPVYQRTPAAVQRRAVEFLSQNLFTTPNWMLDKSILDNIGQDPISILTKLQVNVLKKILDARTLDKLIKADALDGEQAYRVTDLFNDLQKFIFSELNTGQPIDVYRRNLQKYYIEKLIGLAGSSMAGNIKVTDYSPNMDDDISSTVKMQLRAIEKNIKDVINKEDNKSKDHLTDLIERIHRTGTYEK